MLSDIQGSRLQNAQNLFTSYIDIWEKEVLSTLQKQLLFLEERILSFQEISPPDSFMIFLQLKEGRIEMSTNISPDIFNIHRKQFPLSKDFKALYDKGVSTRRYSFHDQLDGYLTVLPTCKQQHILKSTHYFCNFVKRTTSRTVKYYILSIESAAKDLFSKTPPIWDQMMENDVLGGYAASEYSSNGELSEKGWNDFFQYLEKNKNKEETKEIPF